METLQKVICSVIASIILIITLLCFSIEEDPNPYQLSQLKRSTSSNLFHKVDFLKWIHTLIWYEIMPFMEYWISENCIILYIFSRWNIYSCCFVYVVYFLCETTELPVIFGLKINVLLLLYYIHNSSTELLFNLNGSKCGQFGQWHVWCQLKPTGGVI